MLLPDDADATDAPLGVPIGPPPLDDLGLPEDTAVRLHNELYARGVLTIDDARRHRADLVAALMAALRVDAETIYNIYAK